MSIKISPKHGLNPTCLVCPICGKDTSLALLGRLKDDSKAPRQMRDREPCEACQADIEGYKAQGFVFFVISDEYEKHQDEATPWQFFISLSVVKREAAEEMLKDTASGACFVSRTTGTAIGLP